MTSIVFIAVILVAALLAGLLTWLARSIGRYLRAAAR
jgi:archaellum component FlaG (FlaF/FlaG flagellin family)